MAQRLQLQALLEEILGSDHVYFQPPATVRMEYPAIVYKRDDAISQHADNTPYRYLKRYMVTVIDRNPDSQTPDKVAGISTASFNRHFVADGLNHDVFTLYF